MIEMPKRLGRVIKDNRAAAMVEMAVVSPFLLALGLGVFEFSNYYYHRHLIVTGVHDAARFLARVDDPTTTAQVDKAKEIAVYGKVAGTQRRISWWAPADVSVPIPRTVANTGMALYRGPDPIRIVRVETNITDPGLGFLSLLGISTPFRINVFHEERHIGE
jgi:hypothetical protein